MSYKISNPALLPLFIGSIAMSSAAFSDTSTGEALYNGTCVACHGGDGKGVIPGTPDFSAANGPLKKTDEELVRSIMEGIQSAGSPMPMPPKGGNPALTEEQARILVDYLRMEFGSE